MSEASKPDEHDQAYWNAYYAARPADIAKPSSFAVWAWKFLSARPEAERGTTLVDLGCGNGRDTEFFGDKFSVTGIDNSAAAVESNSKNTTRVRNYVTTLYYLFCSPRGQSGQRAPIGCKYRSAPGKSGRCSFQETLQPSFSFLGRLDICLQTQY